MKLCLCCVSCFVLFWVFFSQKTAACIWTKIVHLKRWKPYVKLRGLVTTGHYHIPNHTIPIFSKRWKVHINVGPNPDRNSFRKPEYFEWRVGPQCMLRTFLCMFLCLLCFCTAAERWLHLCRVCCQQLKHNPAWGGVNPTFSILSALCITTSPLLCHI